MEFEIIQIKSNATREFVATEIYIYIEIRI